MAAATVKWLRDSAEQTALSSEMNALANNALALSPVITPTAAGYLFADFTLTVTFAGAPAANSGIAVWLLRETDGSNYEDGGSSVTPGRAPDRFFPLRAASGLQRITLAVPLPFGTFRVLAKNDGTGQAAAASGNSLTFKASTPQQVG